MKKLIAVVIVVLTGVLGHCLLAQEKEPFRKAEQVEKTIENWFYPHYIDDKLAWEAKGKVAIITGQNEIKVESLEFIYYLSTPKSTNPDETPGQQRTINFKADNGVIKQGENITIFKGNVLITGLNNTKLVTEEISSRFDPAKDELTISSDKVVTFINQASMQISGKGLRSENNLRGLTWLEDIEVIISGTDFSLFSPVTTATYQSDTEPAGNHSFDKTTPPTIITCAGPFVVKEISGSDYIKGHKLIFKNDAKLVRKLLVRSADKIKPELNSSSAGHNNTEASGQGELKLTAHILEIIVLKDTLGEMTVLKGKKRVVFSPSAQAEVSANRTVESTPAQNSGHGFICITCQGDAIIYPGFQRIIFRDRVQLTQTNGITVGAQASPETSGPNIMRQDKPGQKGLMTCGRLTLVLDTARNEVKSILAERNVLLLGEEGNYASAEQLEWYPNEYSLVLKSVTAVKLWHQHDLLKANEISIQTAANEFGGLGNWKKIEAKNIIKGVIKIGAAGKE